MSKALEALEQLKQNNKDDTHMFDDELLDIIKNALKAFEIIKSRGVLSVFESSDNKGALFFNAIAVIIPKEEYDLLKETLLWILKKWICYTTKKN